MTVAGSVHRPKCALCTWVHHRTRRVKGHKLWFWEFRCRRCGAATDFLATYPSAHPAPVNRINKLPPHVQNFLGAWHVGGP
jgi:hypothetical protein